MRILPLGLAHIVLTGTSEQDAEEAALSKQAADEAAWREASFFEKRVGPVRIEHKPSTKREARRERKARKIARTCGRHT